LKKSVEGLQMALHRAQKAQNGAFEVWCESGHGLLLLLVGESLVGNFPRSLAEARASLTNECVFTYRPKL
jgi:hypothetical protein